MFMVDVKRPGKEFQTAMLKENVAIGTYVGCDAELRAGDGWERSPRWRSFRRRL